MLPWLFHTIGFLVAVAIPLHHAHYSRNPFALPLKQWLTFGVAIRGMGLFLLAWSIPFFAILFLVRDPATVLVTFVPDALSELIQQHIPDKEAIRQVARSAGVVALGQVIVFWGVIWAARRQMANNVTGLPRRVLRWLLARPYQFCSKEFEYQLWYAQTECVYRASNSSAAVVIEKIWNVQQVVDGYASRGRKLEQAQIKALQSETFTPNRVRHLAASMTWHGLWALMWKEYHDEDNKVFVTEARLRHASRPYLKCSPKLAARLADLYALHDPGQAKRTALSACLTVRGVVPADVPANTTCIWFGD